MNLCDSGHDEVCFEGSTCPACTVGTDKDKSLEEMEQDNIALKVRVEDLEDKIEALSS